MAKRMNTDLHCQLLSAREL